MTGPAGALSHVLHELVECACERKPFGLMTAADARVFAAGRRRSALSDVDYPLRGAADDLWRALEWERLAAALDARNANTVADLGDDALDWSVRLVAPGTPGGRPS